MLRIQLEMQIEQCVAEGRTLEYRFDGKHYHLLATQPNATDVILLAGLDERQHAAYSEAIKRYWTECLAGRKTSR